VNIDLAAAAGDSRLYTGIPLVAGLAPLFM
jgi:hypothetical protein